MRPDVVARSSLQPKGGDLTRQQVVQIGGRAALAGTFFVWALLHQAPMPAAAQSDAGGRAWDARVDGTGDQGLQVREGPGIDFAVQAVIYEGATVRVLEGPRFDRDGRSWYKITGFNRASSTGWSAGDYLAGSPPAPRDTVMAASGVSVAGAQTFMATITAYTYQVPGNGAHGTITKSGTQARWGTVAVDPRVIPLGTRLMIDGFDNVFIAEDTGGGVRGDHVEIFYTTYQAAMDFGVQRRAVTVLPGGSR
jgi:3D (Asp-Asp-Asp) domain-containing protein